MNQLSKFTDGVFLIDFEFRPENGREGNTPETVCLVVRDFPSGATRRYWQDELYAFTTAPFSVESGALCVAYFASAELDCFIKLGWPLPENVLDLFVEFRCMTNGTTPPNGAGLLGALLYFGLPTITAQQKDAMRDLVLRGGLWTESERRDILDYCETDVCALAQLLPAMLPSIDLPRALMRGRYMKAVSRMQATGTPIDTETLREIENHWEDIQDALIAQIDANYGVYEGRTFKMKNWADYLQREGIPWPRLPTGLLELTDDTFKEMARIYPKVAPIRELRSALSEMRLSNLTVGEDGRNRCLLSPFSAKTGRNQPSNSRFIFGPSVWLRGLIKPQEGFCLAYIDYSQQEFGIAAALSGDEKMMEAYRSGDPYLAFAIQAGAVPQGATKQTHKAEREQFKACVLAVQYGMGEVALAQRINQPVARARQLLALHRQTYKTFWVWSDATQDEAVLNGKLWTTFGWEIRVNGAVNPRSLRNFPMQGNGAEMLRIACIFLTEAGIRVCAPVHDALLIELPVGELESGLTKAQDLMRQASRAVLGDFELGSDAKVVCYPDRYMDERGLVMWATVTELIHQIKHSGLWQQASPPVAADPTRSFL
jgi:DNA polymerase I